MSLVKNNNKLIIIITARTHARTYARTHARTRKRLCIRKAKWVILFYFFSRVFSLSVRVRVRVYVFVVVVCF